MRDGGWGDGESVGAIPCGCPAWLGVGCWMFSSFLV